MLFSVLFLILANPASAQTIGASTYVNVERGYSFAIPPGWNVENLPKEGDKIIYPNTHVMYTVPGASSQQDYIKNLKDYIYGPRIAINSSVLDPTVLLSTNKSSLDQCKKISEFVKSTGHTVNKVEEKTLPKIEGNGCLIQYEGQEKEYNNPTSIVIIQHGLRVHTISLVAGNSGYYTNGNDAFEMILNSFNSY